MGQRFGGTVRRGIFHWGRSRRRWTQMWGSPLTNLYRWALGRPSIKGGHNLIIRGSLDTCRARPNPAPGHGPVITAGGQEQPVFSKIFILGPQGQLLGVKTKKEETLQ